jgi:uncharacterized membrane-anchored protein
MNQELLRIAKICSALTWGAIMASLQALRPLGEGFSFQVSWLTFAAFIGGTAAVYFFWWIVLHTTAGSHQKLWRRLAEVLLVLSGMAAFLYPLRFVPKAKLPEISLGLAVAAVALSIVGCMLLGIRRFLNADDRQNDPP